MGLTTIGWTETLRAPLELSGGQGGKRPSIDIATDCPCAGSKICGSFDGVQTKYFDFVVFAAPLDVLRERIAKVGDEDVEEKLSFQPSLTFSKSDTISNVGFGLLDKVTLALVR